MSTVTPNLKLFKYNTTSDSNIAFNINTALNNNWDKIDEAVSNLGGARNIGEIVFSTIPLTDAGLHLLDGSLIQGNGIYSDFVDYIAGLVSTYPDLFVTESEWQQSITDYGVCGKFVYDNTNNTVRLPKITGKLDGTTDVNALGELIEQFVRLPNITGELNIGGNGPNLTGAFYRDGNQSGECGGDGGTDAHGYFDASRCSSVYSGNGTDTKIHEQAINVLYYIVIATSTKTDIQVDIDTIATDLNNKVDRGDLQEVQCVVETYVNGESWYRVYSDGWCEQGGRAALNETSTTTITLLKSYKNTNYSVSAVSITASTAGDTEAGLQCTPISTTQIHLTAHYINPNSQTACWQACGYIEV